jgi:hypothetical protein
MKLPLVFCVVALAVAGSSFAQPVSDHPNGVVSPPDSGAPSADYPPTARELAQQKAVRQARSQMLLSCAADRQALCGSKNFARRPEEYLYYYRVKVSAACRQSQDQVELAARGG